MGEINKKSTFGWLSYDEGACVASQVQALQGLAIALVIEQPGSTSNYGNPSLDPLLEQGFQTFHCGGAYLLHSIESELPYDFTGMVMGDLGSNNGLVELNYPETFVISELVEDYLQANGTYTMTTKAKNDKPTYVNENGWVIWWNGTDWSLTDDLANPTMELKNGDGDPVGGIWDCPEGCNQSGKGPNSPTPTPTPQNLPDGSNTTWNQIGLNPPPEESGSGDILDEDGNLPPPAEVKVILEDKWGGCSGTGDATGQCGDGQMGKGNFGIYFFNRGMSTMAGLGSGPVGCVPIDEWVQVTITRYGQIVSMYINGKCTGSTTLAPLQDSSQATSRLVFGKIDGGTWYSDQAFNGDLTNLGIWHRPLSSIEVAGLYDSGRVHWDDIKAATPTLETDIKLYNSFRGSNETVCDFKHDQWSLISFFRSTQTNYNLYSDRATQGWIIDTVEHTYPATKRIGPFPNLGTDHQSPTGGGGTAPARNGLWIKNGADSKNVLPGLSTSQWTFTFWAKKHGSSIGKVSQQKQWLQPGTQNTTPAGKTGSPINSNNSATMIGQYASTSAGGGNMRMSWAGEDGAMNHMLAMWPDNSGICGDGDIPVPVLDAFPDWVSINDTLIFTWPVSAITAVVYEIVFDDQVMYTGPINSNGYTYLGPELMPETEHTFKVRAGIQYGENTPVLNWTEYAVKTFNVLPHNDSD